MTHKLKPEGRRKLQRLSEDLRQTRIPGGTLVPADDAEAALIRRLKKGRTLRRTDLRKLVPLSDTTIDDLERKGEFPKRFYLTARCVVWSLEEVLDWIEARRINSYNGDVKLAPFPNVSQRDQPAR